MSKGIYLISFKGEWRYRHTDRLRDRYVYQLAERLTDKREPTKRDTDKQRITPND